MKQPKILSVLVMTLLIAVLTANTDTDIAYLSASAPLYTAEAYAGWREVGPGSASGGGISNNSGWSEAPSLAIAPDGTPYVAWKDETTGIRHIYVRRWNGSNWEEVGAGSASGGGIDNSPEGANSPSLAIAPGGTPYIAWKDWYGGWDGSDQIYVRRWNGSSWVEVGAGSASGRGISNTTDGYSISPEIAIAPDGTPYVAWQWDIWSGYAEIYVRRWNGKKWVEVGPGSASGGGISNTNNNDSSHPKIAIAPDGTPYVAWTEGPYSEYYDPDVYIRRWNGSSWEEVGAGSASGEGIISIPWLYSPLLSLAIAPDNTPYVSWVNWYIGGFSIRRWNGHNWEDFGGDIAFSDLGGGGSLAIALCIASDEIGQALVGKKWDRVPPLGEASVAPIYLPGPHR